MCERCEARKAMVQAIADNAKGNGGIALAASMLDKVLDPDPTPVAFKAMLDAAAPEDVEEAVFFLNGVMTAIATGLVVAKISGVVPADAEIGVDGPFSSDQMNTMLGAVKGKGKKGPSPLDGVREITMKDILSARRGNKPEVN